MFLKVGVLLSLEVISTGNCSELSVQVHFVTFFKNVGRGFVFPMSLCWIQFSNTDHLYFIFPPADSEKQNPGAQVEDHVYAKPDLCCKSKLSAPSVCGFTCINTLQSKEQLQVPANGLEIICFSPAPYERRQWKKTCTAHYCLLRTFLNVSCSHSKGQTNALHINKRN